MNFGETLTYWYLRLNGFFPLSNFVLHQSPEPQEENRLIRRSADCDILALRLPHVYEEIGGRVEDWDHNQFNEWRIDLLRQPICLIVEVKTGAINLEDIERTFRPGRLTYALRRVGMWHPDYVPAIVEHLSESATHVAGNVTIAKLLVTPHDMHPIDGASPHHHLSINAIEHFIQQRMRRYPKKGRDRMFFPDDLIQYFAWKSGVPLQPDELA